MTLKICAIILLITGIPLFVYGSVKENYTALMIGGFSMTWALIMAFNS